MVKKEKQKYQVLRSMTEGDIKTLGGNRWTRRKAKTLIAIAVACFAWMIFISYLVENGWMGVVVTMFPAGLVWLIWALRFDKEGKKLWNEVKDKAQPIDLG